MIDQSGFNSRRDFLRAGALALASGVVLSQARLFAQETENKPGSKPDKGASAKRVVLVYANGGPSQFETFDPKPGQKTGAPFKVLKTDVPGFTPVEHLPEIAKLAGHFCLIRNLRSNTVDHSHARHLMHTGWLSNPTIVRPGLGNIVYHQMGDLEFDLPGFVKLGGDVAPGGFLGSGYSSFAVQKAGEQVKNLEYADGVDKDRLDRRMKIVREMDDDFGKARDDEAVKSRQAALDKARRLMNSPLRDRFLLDDESADVWKSYGESEFAKQCVVARRLLEAGVKAIEIQQDGWDTHDDAFNRNTSNCKNLDQPFGAFIRDLKQRGMLDSTLVLFYGDFGRSPKLTSTNGRGHSAANFCALLAGGGVKGGQVIGETNEDGTSLVTDSHNPRDLFATIGHLCGWQTQETFMAGKRPTYLVDPEALPIKAVYS
ncbi:MAG: DUF1501 domain-containing protein [Planctomycetes bacterium]|nr:DUF1501 domain-containing protein [Planctomycetota bacterium]